MTFTTNVVPFKFYQARQHDEGKPLEEIAQSFKNKPDRIERENNSGEPIKAGEMLFLHYA